MAAGTKQTLYALLVLTCGIVQVSGFLFAGSTNNQTYTCDLEQGACAYTSLLGAHLRWQRHAVSLVTKPTSDHTLASSGRGHVFDVKTTTTTRAGENTTLISPTMSGLLGSTVVEFWYSISGSGNSFMNFSVVAKPTSSSNSTTTLFTRLVHGYVHWTRVCTVLPVIGSMRLAFVVQALHTGMVGDLAIDDITVKHGNYCTNQHVTSLPPTTTGNSVTCDFEARGTCGYKDIVSPKDNFNWLRIKGSTGSTGTGPTGDHTTRHGHYMYIETSSPRHPGDHALLESPSFSTNVPQHVSFWYNAHGNTVGSLKVYIKHGTSLGTPTIITSTGSSTSVWKHACVYIPASRVTSHIVFEGVVGSSYTGDIAIDDVMLGTGSCTSGGHAVDGQWGSWSSYSACSVSCGTGHVTSTRVCNHPAPSNGGQQCIGASAKQSTCHQPSCPVNGHWSAWSSYTTCSVSCGTGYRHSNRSCTQPPPRYGGHVCTGSSQRTLTCRLSTCPVDGQWGSWSAWSACAVTCGSGHVTSSRVCNKPSPSNGGHNCVGASSKQNSCQMTSCTVDGDWSDWTTWSVCSTSCDLGTISRDRSCSKPVPSGGGKQCTGNHSESHECSQGPCPTWSHWYQGDCSSTCGNGTAERMRSCSTGNNADCAGISYDHVQCIGTECI